MNLSIHTKRKNESGFVSYYLLIHADSIMKRKYLCGILPSSYCIVEHPHSATMTEQLAKELEYQYRDHDLSRLISNNAKVANYKINNLQNKLEK